MHPLTKAVLKDEAKLFSPVIIGLGATIVTGSCLPFIAGLFTLAGIGKLYSMRQARLQQ